MAQPKAQIDRKVPDTILAAMRDTNDVFVREVIARRNTQALDQVYTTDARILPPGVERIEGREKVKEYWGQAIHSLNVTSVELSTVEAEQLGDRILEIGHASLRTGEGQTVSVKYIVVWKQEDSRWKWAIDIWNQNS